VKLSGARVYFERKPRLTEHVKHRVICRYDLSLKYLNSICRRDFRKLAQEDRTESASLKIIRENKTLRDDAGRVKAAL